MSKSHNSDMKEYVPYDSIDLKFKKQAKLICSDGSQNEFPSEDYVCEKVRGKFPGCWKSSISFFFLYFFIQQVLF